MTTSIRRLLAQIATFEAQNRAGLTPLPGELIEFFETAREARRDVRALETGMVPPMDPLTTPTATPLVVERVDGVVELRASVPLPIMARAVLDQLTAAAGDKTVVIPSSARGGVASA